MEKTRIVLYISVILGNRLVAQVIERPQSIGVRGGVRLANTVIALVIDDAPEIDFEDRPDLVIEQIRFPICWHPAEKE